MDEQHSWFGEKILIKPSHFPIGTLTPGGTPLPQTCRPVGCLINKIQCNKLVSS